MVLEKNLKKYMFIALEVLEKNNGKILKKTLKNAFVILMVLEKKSSKIRVYSLEGPRKINRKTLKGP